MLLSVFSMLNRKRAVSPSGFNHELNQWTTSDWIVATLGELGEAANIVKKLNRHRDGIIETIPVNELKNMLKDEIADTFIYLDLMTQSLGLDLENIVKHKWNKTSEKIGYPGRI